MIWFKINLPAKLFFPDMHQSDFTFFTKHQRQPELGMFGAKLTGDTTKGPPCRGDKIIFHFISVAVLLTHLFHPLCVSFAQLSFNVIVRLNTSLPGALSLSKAK